MLPAERPQLDAVPPSELAGVQEVAKEVRAVGNLDYTKGRVACIASRSG